MKISDRVNKCQACGGTGKTPLPPLADYIESTYCTRCFGCGKESQLETEDFPLLDKFFKFPGWFMARKAEKTAKEGLEAVQREKRKIAWLERYLAQVLFPLAASRGEFTFYDVRKKVEEVGFDSPPDKDDRLWWIGLIHAEKNGWCFPTAKNIEINEANYINRKMPVWGSAIYIEGQPLRVLENHNNVLDKAMKG